MLTTNLVPIICSLVFCRLVYANKDNVGTVLFTESENAKNCWSNSRIALLHTRLIFQDVLPDKSVLCMHDDSFVTAFIDYFRMTVDTVKTMTFGRTKEITLIALTDVLGGYMHHLALPLAKHSFYVGNINYESIEKLYQLYEELKGFLRTNGKFWAPPTTYKKTVKRDDPKTPLPLPLSSDHLTGDPCNGLIYYEDPNGGITVPMPFLDSNIRPNSIAVPFRKASLHSLQGKGSSYILVKYYLTSLKCLLQRRASKGDIVRFETNFKQFLDDHILNHVNDDRFYPAFGSVYRILATLNSTTPPKQHEVVVMKQKETNHMAQILLTALACVIIVWLLAGIVFCCCRIPKDRKEQQQRYAHASQSKQKQSKAKPKFLAMLAQRKAKKEAKKSNSKELDEPKIPEKQNSQPNNVNDAPSKMSQKGTDPMELSTKNVACNVDNCYASLKSEKSTATSTTKTSKKDTPKKDTPKKDTPKKDTPKKDTPKKHKRFPLFNKKKSQSPSNAKNNSSSTTTSSDKPMVFGYDFENDATTEESTSVDSSSRTSSPR